MTRVLWMVLWWLVGTASAADLRLNVDGTLAEPIPVLIVDSSGTAFTGQTLSTVDLYYSCGTTSYQLNETGDTLTELSAALRPGEYAWTTNDVIGTNCPAPKVLTISGGGTDRDVPVTLFGLLPRERYAVLADGGNGTSSFKTDIGYTLNIPGGGGGSQRWVIRFDATPTCNVAGVIATVSSFNPTTDFLTLVEPLPGGTIPTTGCEFEVVF